MSVNLTNPPEIFDRKNHSKELQLEALNKSLPSSNKRQMVLRSQNADGLSDQDLISHRRELRLRRVGGLITFLAVPASTFVFGYNPRLLVLSLLPAWYMAKAALNSRVFNTETNFSIKFAQNSKKRYYKHVMNSNRSKVWEPLDCWTMFDANYKPIPVREWINRNEYR
jgi:hypothetical protein